MLGESKIGSMWRFVDDYSHQQKTITYLILRDNLDTKTKSFLIVDVQGDWIADEIYYPGNILETNEDSYFWKYSELICDV
jgi:hypothetical protein